MIEFNRTFDRVDHNVIACKLWKILPQKRRYNNVII